MAGADVPSTCWVTEGHFPCGACWWRQRRGSKSDQASVPRNDDHDNDDWEETLCWIAWFTPAWQAQYVPSTWWATVKVISLVTLAGGGKVEGS